MDVVVTGIGLVSALGTLADTWRRINSNQTGIKICQPFSDLPPRPMALIDSAPAPLLELTQRVVAAAADDAKLTAPVSNCAVVIGSSRSQQPRWEAFLRSDRQFSQSHSIHSGWLQTLPHMPAIATARQIGASGPLLSPMAACASGLWAIAQAYELLQLRQCDRVIAGAVEAPISPLTLIGFDRAGALATTGAYPFDCQREGLVLGEGAAVFVMESLESAVQRSAQIYGRILGIGLTADGYHVSAPDPSGQTGAIAIKQCLERSKLTPNAIDYIHAHGTATQLNDRNEARLIEQLFSHKVAVSSTKGATGHTLGASGAIGAALCLMALHHQQIPPCVGLTRPEFDLNLITTSTPRPIQTTLCLSFGFGGQNVAIAFGKDERWG